MLTDVSNATSPPPLVFDVTTDGFEADVLQASLATPVLVDFWAAWCGPCKTLGPVLEKLAADFNGAFRLAKVDVDKEQQLAAAFQVRSIPTIFLVKDGQPVDGFPGALPEAQLREFLKHHGIEPAAPLEPEVATNVERAPPDPHAEVLRLRKLVETEADKPEHRLDLALALLGIGAASEAETLLDALPANLSTDDRAVRARTRLGVSTALKDAPPVQVLEAAITADPADLRARHLLGLQRIAAGDEEGGLEQFLEMLQRDRNFEGGLPKKALIDAFRIIEDANLVSRYRRRMSALLLI